MNPNKITKYLETLSIKQLERLNEHIWKKMNYGNCDPLLTEHPHFLQILNTLGDIHQERTKCTEPY